jgi:hypothetical protein
MYSGAQDRISPRPVDLFFLYVSGKNVCLKIPYARGNNNFTGIRSLPVPVVTFRKMSVTFGKVRTPRAIRKGSEDHGLCA